MDNINRRKLLSLMATSPLLGLAAQPVRSSTVANVDLEIAEIYWQTYRSTNLDPKDYPILPRCEDRQAEDALHTIAAPIMATSSRRDIAWRIGLVTNGQVNAVTPGGGVIFVYDGLIKLCKSEAELASVIAHEVGHIEHRHAIRRIYTSKVFEDHGVTIGSNTQQIKSLFEQRKYDIVADTMLYKSYKRLWEHEADAYIIHAFRKTRYPLEASYTFFESMIREFGAGSPDLCIYSSHPEMKKRITRLKNLSKAYRITPARPDSEAFRYLKQAIG